MNIRLGNKDRQRNQLPPRSATSSFTSKPSTPRRALVDITNNNSNQIPVANPVEPVEYMPTLPVTPKFKGCEFEPENEPWFDDDDEVTYEPVNCDGAVDW